ncbi:MAG: radical SAM protein [Hyphomicrobiaceae bacterium]|nr:radical SAM protein [Hyphomicrobiaceae bacterium]
MPVNDHGPAIDLPSLAKFEHPEITATGETRATVALERLETVWFNTGTLCNIACVNCYIESSPSNDRLAYLAADEVTALLDEILRDALGTAEIGFTGGEPFMNPDFLTMLGAALERGFDVLVLTNAMQPMQRPAVKRGLLALKERHGARLRLRVSLDHFTAELHEAERGPRTFAKTIEGIDWLNANGFEIAIAGRTCWNEPEHEARNGYAALIAKHGWRIDPANPKQMMLLPEMDGSRDVPEITTRCWSLLNKRPSDMMCAKSRMVVKRKGAKRASVLPCTLLPYDRAFEMGATFAEARAADSGMFARGTVRLCHPNCAKFCVLGGGSCS